jgi:hypothetical protein
MSNYEKYVADLSVLNLVSDFVKCNHPIRHVCLSCVTLPPMHLICQHAVLLVLTVLDPAWPLSIEGETMQTNIPN